MIFELTNEEKKALLQAVAKGVLNTDKIPRIANKLINSPYEQKTNEELDEEIRELQRKLGITPNNSF